MSRFEWFDFHTDSWICPICSAVVRNIEKHIEWHDLIKSLQEKRKEL